MELGGGRYQVGSIVVDKAAGRFEVPGRTIELAGFDVPLEFVAVTRSSGKGYEALLELDTSGIEFNLACILIGLESGEIRRPEYHFDPNPAEGPPVELGISWELNGETVSRRVEDLLRGVEPGTPHEWAYAGSFFDEQGFAAEHVGILIGFVHDPISIIQHKAGLGLGNYGAITPNSKTLPPAGTPVRLTLSNANVRGREDGR